MKRILASLTLVAALVPLPLIAGGKDYKCKEETQTCLDKMAQKLQGRGWVGLEFEDKDMSRLTVTRVVPGSPAEKGGFKVGDVLVSVNGVRFADNTEEKCVTCEATADNWKPGSAVKYVVSRAGGQAHVDVTLAEMPREVMAQMIGMHMMEHAQVKVAAK